MFLSIRTPAAERMNNKDTAKSEESTNKKEGVETLFSLG